MSQRTCSVTIITTNINSLFSVDLNPGNLVHRLCRYLCNVYNVPLSLHQIGFTFLHQQNRLRWYSHVLRKDDDDWVKKCMEYEVEGSRPRGRPKKTWKEVACEDCQARKLNKEDAMDRCKWRKVIKEAR